MKILDRYILKSFLIPFFATFFIVLFVLVMQALWLAFDNIAGKGISLFFIFKFLYYTSLIVVAQALPIAVLLSSIMALGNLSENYEFAAAKSASISLLRFLRPLIVLTFLLSILNFFFLNNIFPYAILKQKNLRLNIQKKKPALALIPGSFNTEIPNYQIKFNEKYGEEENLLKKVLIYDLTSGKGNKKVITAKNGKIVTEEGSKYMTFILYDGYYYEEHTSKTRSFSKIDKMPASSANFKEYAFNIDISSFMEDDLDKQKYKNNPGMLSLGQLKDTIPILKVSYDESLESRSKKIYHKTSAKELFAAKDSIEKYKLEKKILDNFEINGKISVIGSAINSLKFSINNVKSSLISMKRNRKKLNLYDVQFHNRIALSLSCLILFFIGAPLGSIIRKGGFGLPMILAICIYVIYFFANTFGKNLAEESSITAIMGSWVSSVLMIPFAFFLTRRASKGMGLFNSNPVLLFFRKAFLKEKTKEQQKVEKKIIITDEDIQVSEKFRLLNDSKLIDAIKNYRQYSYTKGEREVGLKILEERGITKEELILKGEYENKQHITALNSYDAYRKNSKIAVTIYIASFISNIFLAILKNNMSFSQFADITSQIIFLVLFNIIFLIYAIKSLNNYTKMNKALNKKLELGGLIAFIILGLPLYIILYFYTLSEAKEKIKAIR